MDFDTKIIWIVPKNRELYTLVKTSVGFGFVCVSNKSQDIIYLDRTVYGSVAQAKKDGLSPREDPDIVTALKSARIINQRNIVKHFKNVNHIAMGKRIWSALFWSFLLVGIMAIVTARPPLHVGILIGFLYVGSLLFAIDRIVPRIIYGVDK